MAANSPDTPLSAVEIQELRRLLAEQRRPGWRADPLAATLVGVFAAGFLGLIGWLGYATTENGKTITGLEAGQKHIDARLVTLETGQEELKADIAELQAGQRELKVILLEQRRR